MEEKQAQEDLGEEIGEITHFFNKINVAVVKLTKGSLSVGDKIRIKGATTDFEQGVDSMQVDHANIDKADIGKELGMKVAQPVRQHDIVYKV
ncbi:hypothetical protein JXB41_00860 [Candidatus Woesearchaeota archaeon]|nr:hypothetical protein [Candidatus Woesearchaeota archaeon]